MSTENVSAEQLRLLIERIERLEEDKKGISDDIKDVYSEAKGTGFDGKTIREIIKLRKMDVATRREREALLETYKAALGLLDGTPLGRWAIERLKRPQKSETPASADAPDDAPGDDSDDSDDSDDIPLAPEKSIPDARAMGAEAARGGKSVTTNPFPPRDERRAAWDEAWCGELGSDGMDIPDAWKPAKKFKPDDSAANEGENA